jgi:hypothetical protein
MTNESEFPGLTKLGKGLGLMEDGMVGQVDQLDQLDQRNIVFVFDRVEGFLGEVKLDWAVL